MALSCPSERQDLERTPRTRRLRGPEALSCSCDRVHRVSFGRPTTRGVERVSAFGSLHQRCVRPGPVDCPQLRWLARGCGLADVWLGEMEARTSYESASAAFYCPPLATWAAAGREKWGALHGLGAGRRSGPLGTRRFAEPARLPGALVLKASLTDGPLAPGRGGAVLLVCVRSPRSRQS